MPDGHVKIKTNQHKMKSAITEQILGQSNPDLISASFTDCYGIVFEAEGADPA